MKNLKRVDLQLAALRLADLLEDLRDEGRPVTSFKITHTAGNYRVEIRMLDILVEDSDPQASEAADRAITEFRSELALDDRAESLENVTRFDIYEAVR